MAKLITTLNTGDKIKLGTYKVEGSTTLPIIWKLIAIGHTGYPSNAVTLITEKVIDYRGFDAIEAANYDSNRANYGNNRWRTSNIRQWLNSGGGASAWWTAQNLSDGVSNTKDKDTRPVESVFTHTTGYDDIAGFLSNFTAQELGRIPTVTNITAKNTVTDGGSFETTDDYVYFLSTTEMGYPNQGGIAEGYAFEAFTGSYIPRTTTMTEQAFYSSLSSSKGILGNNYPYYLRTPQVNLTMNVRNVSIDGSENAEYAYMGNQGIRPVTNLSPTTYVSDEVDGDGCYTLVFNSTPTISGSNSDLGNKTASFTQDFSVNDTDSGDTLTLTVKVDTTTIQTINNAVRSQAYTADISSVFSSLTLASHSLIISVADGTATATRTYTFTKVDDRIEFTLANPIQTSAAARKIVLSGILTVPDGATLTVEACNNGLDASPTWEDITTEYEARQAYTFTNAAKTDANWGVNVHFLILKGTAVSNVEVAGFGLSFE